MRIFYPEDLFKIVKQKWLLLDTNVFIDSFNFNDPTQYISFFNTLKDNDTTLTTIDSVIHEFLKGSKSPEVFTRKNQHINDIIDSKLPSKENNERVNELILQYAADGGSISIVDYYLGASLLQYKDNLFLMTRDIKDFPQNIFSLCSTVSFPSEKTVFTYGIYTYLVKKQKEIDPMDVPF